MQHLAQRAAAWLEYEPIIAVMMVLATVVLFVEAYRLGKGANLEGLWPWVRSIVEAAAVAALFMGLLWGFRAVLNDNARTFSATHGRVSEANLNSVKTIWGEPHIQRELNARLVDKSGADSESDDSVLVTDDAITAFTGVIAMQINERRKGSALYSGFEAQLDLVYEIHNPAEVAATADLHFPLMEQRLLEDLHVDVDGRAVEDLTIGSGVRWSEDLDPGETIRVRVAYRTRGVEMLYYQVPQARHLRDFELTVDITGMLPSQVNYPGSCLTPSAVEPLGDAGTRLRWTLDHAITTAGMGVALPHPIQPGAEVALVLSRSPYGLMLLVVGVSLTLLVRRDRLSFLDLALLAAGYCVLFLTMAAVSDTPLGFWGSLALGASLATGLSSWLFRRHAARRPIALLVGFFALVYPLAGLLPEHEPSIDGGVAVGLILYLFALALGQERARVATPSPDSDATLPG